jgi:hypothetical protein
VELLVSALNTNQIPEYFREIKLILLSKTNSSEVELNETRPIAIASHLSKIFEKAIKVKLDQLGSKLL